MTCIFMHVMHAMCGACECKYKCIHTCGMYMHMHQHVYMYVHVHVIAFISPIFKMDSIVVRKLSSLL